jgi:stress-induced-phosphoprotein 1
LYFKLAHTTYNVQGYSRKGAALALLNRHEEAMMAYMEGLNHDSTNEQLREGIRQSKQHLSGK